jgi:hypothetical protein
LALSLSGDSGVDFRIDAREWRRVQGGVVGRCGHNMCELKMAGNALSLPFVDVWEG